MWNKRKGFSSVELAVVVITIAVIIGVAYWIIGS